MSTCPTLPVHLSHTCPTLAAAVTGWAWWQGYSELLWPLASLAVLSLAGAALLAWLHRLGQDDAEAVDRGSLLQHAEQLSARGELDPEAVERLRQAASLPRDRTRR